MTRSSDFTARRRHRTNRLLVPGRDYTIFNPPVDSETDPKDPFGRLPQRDDTPISKLREAWRNGRLETAVGRTSIQDSVGDGATNAPNDVAVLETMLQRNGVYDLTATEGPTGIYGPPQRDALLRFQKDRGLKADALVRPDGPTIRSLASNTPERDTAPDDRLADLLSARPEGEAEPDRASAQETQVAAAPAAALVPFLWQLGRVAVTQGVRSLLGETATTAATIAAGAAVLKDKPEVPKRVAPAGKPMMAPPPLPDETPEQAKARRAATNEGLVKDIIGIVLENRRGDETTQHGNDIFAQECRAILNEEFPDIADRVEHLYGAYKDGVRGEKGVYLKEKYIPRVDAERGDHRNASHSDLAWGLVDENRKEVKQGPKAHANTVSMRKDGSMTGDERRRFDNMVLNAAEHVVKYLRKYRPGDDEDEYRKDARKVCRAMFKDLKESIRKHDEKTTGKTKTGDSAGESGDD
jgi:hypothetical protein